MHTKSLIHFLAGTVPVPLWRDARGSCLPAGRAGELHIRFDHFLQMRGKVIKKVQMKSGSDLAKSGFLLKRGFDFIPSC
jgi:hypothetical protein